jgi:putative oxidoreductase
MSRVEPSPGSGLKPPGGYRLDGELAVLQHVASPALLLARAMLVYIFIVEGFGKIANYQAVSGYMAQHGVPSALLPAVILTELGGGLLVLFGFKTRWAAIALGGFCLLTALLFHLRAEETIQFQKNIAIAGGFLALATAGPGRWSVDAWRSQVP